MSTQLKLLGSPSVAHDGAWLEPPPGKVSALLFYLAFKDTWVNRQDIAYLFWPDIPETNARSNLRKLLARTKALPYARDLEAERNRLRWQVDTDLKSFKEAVNDQQFVTAVQHYRGDLLQGFHMDDAPEFEYWLEAERGALRRLWRKTVSAYAKYLESSERHAEAAEVLSPLQDADPFDEDALRRRLRNLHLSGQQRQALAAFEAFQVFLEREMGMEPEPATLELIEHIRNSDVTPVVSFAPAAAQGESSTQAKPMISIPAQPTPFVGREGELRNLSEQLNDPACRLLTIVAPGGMGKTRLAVAAAEGQVTTFAHGVHFVPLAPVTSPEGMVYAVADAAGFSFSGQEEPRAQLLDYLKPKTLLLVLDNLEHLLPDTSLITDILGAAPQVKLLATSRERLNLQAEWLFELHGLSFPKDEQAEDITRCDAVKLFVQAARKHQADFKLDEATTAPVRRICQLVQGLPLATELAAAWLGLLTVDDISEEISQGIDLLESNLRDVPERQRSVRAVFDASWKQLSDEERRVFAGLSVFRGGFTRAAAREVASASLEVLRILVSKSLITAASGRYGVHELLRQYAAAKLSPKAKAGLNEAHGRYFLKVLSNFRAEVFFTDPVGAADAVEGELENLRTSLHWAIEEARVDLLASPTSFHFSMLCQVRSRYAEGLEVLSRIAAMLDAQPPTRQAQHALMEVLVDQGWYYLRFGQLDEVERVAERSAKLLTELDLPLYDHTGTYPQLVLAAGALARGDYAVSERYAEAAEQMAEALGHLVNLEVASYYLGRTALARGEKDRAETYAKEALKLAEKAGELWFRAYILIALGDIALASHQFEEAEDFFHQSFAIRQQFKDNEGVALASNRLGDVAMARSQPSEAKSHYARARDAYETVNDYGGLGRALAGLGDAALATGQPDEAARCLKEALALCAGRPFYRVTLRVMVSVAHLLIYIGQVDKGAEALAFVKQHPASDQRIAERLSEVLSLYPDLTLSAVATEDDLHSFVTQLIEGLE